MTLDELMSLRRGDVVEWIYDRALGLVTKRTDMGVVVMWEVPCGILRGPYSQPGDAEKMRLIGRATQPSEMESKDPVR